MSCYSNRYKQILNVYKWEQIWFKFKIEKQKKIYTSKKRILQLKFIIMEKKVLDNLKRPIADLCVIATTACVELMELRKQNYELKVELETTKNMLKEKDQQIIKLIGDFKVEEELMKKDSELKRKEVRK